MTLEDMMISRMDFFTFGRVLETGQGYVSIPVVLGKMDDSEYYAINEAELSTFQSDYSAAAAMADS